ncbi:MAG TPA: AAA family ATPase [Polyangium sp.]|nr:AAA family ATPase [Polyangium sp.]
MLTDFNVRGFRCFEQLEIPRLRRLNLITGKNGTGKTTLLEALRVYACDGSPDDLSAMLDARGESGIPSAVDALATIFGVSSSPFDWSTKTCELGPSATPLQLRMRWYQWRKKEGRAAGGDWIETTERAGSEAFVIVVRSEKSAEEHLPADWATLRKPTSAWNPLLPSFFVGLSGVSVETMDSIWQQIVLEGKDTEVLQAVGLLEPRIARLAFVRDTRSNSTQARIAFHDSRTPRPLSALGAGVHRFLGLLLACHAARGGLLLIDEIDTGLHYSVQTRVWELLTAWANQFDVQVFATTHSLDCVRAFAEVAKRDESAQSNDGMGLAQVIRLGRRGDSALRAFLFEDAETFEMVADDELEVR